VLSPEAIELVFLEQTRALRRVLADTRDPDPLAAPGWFWHDFPDAAWADRVRALPREDSARFEAVMRERFTDALTASETPPTQDAGLVAPSSPSSGDATALSAAIDTIVSLTLPDPVTGPDPSRLQSVVEVRRRTEGDEAPLWQGATSEHIGNIRTTSNAASGDASPAECRRTFTTDC
jgi:hypothetical protein